MTKQTIAFRNFANAPKSHPARQCCRILLQKPTATQFREVFFSYGVQGLIIVFTTLLTGSYPNPKNLSELAIVCYRSLHAIVKGDEIKAVFTHATTHTHTHTLSLSLSLSDAVPKHAGVFHERKLSGARCSLRPYGFCLFS
jgi:hypothetical protein